MEPDPANIMDLSFDRLAKMLEENNELRTSALANGRDSRVRQLEHNYGIIQAIYQHKEDQGEIDGSETGEEDGSRENNGSGDDDDGDGAFSETDEDKAARLDAAERISEIAEHLVSMESRGEHRPLEIANHFEHQPAPPPPPAAEDHIPFELSDDEASSDVHDSESEALLLGLASGTGPSVFGAPLSPEPDEPEVVVLDDSDDDDLPRNGERDSERESSSDNMMVDEDATLEAQRRSESSEPMSYADVSAPLMCNSVSVSNLFASTVRLEGAELRARHDQERPRARLLGPFDTASLRRARRLAGAPARPTRRL